jgi:glycosyltransferase involved in cell wall biosynthesis
MIHYDPGLFGKRGFVRLLQGLTRPVILVLHNLPLMNDAGTEATVRYLTLRSSKIVVPLESLACTLQERYQVDPKKLIVIPWPRNAVVPTAKVSREEAKQRLGWAGRKVLLTYGFVGPYKGIDLVCRALPTVVERYPNLLYVSVGRVHYRVLHPEAYLADLQALIKELGLEQNVLIDSTYATEEHLSLCLAACDLYVCPHLVPGGDNQISSGTIPDALSHGRAVLSVPHRYAKEMIADKRGLLFDPTPESLAQRLTYALDNPDLVAAMEQAAVKLRPRLTWSYVADSYKGMLSEL